MRQYIADHDWLTVYHLPAYAPDLNPVEGIWSLIPWVSGFGETSGS
jgi:transposase